MTEENYPQREDTSFDALYAEIQAQLEAIEARSRLMEWPVITVSTAGTTVASSGRGWYEIVTPGSHAPKKPKPIRAKVRYRARWRKEQIERKLRRV
jgi:hypothetical protein